VVCRSPKNVPGLHGLRASFRGRWLAKSSFRMLCGARFDAGGIALPSKIAKQRGVVGQHGKSSTRLLPVSALEACERSAIPNPESFPPTFRSSVPVHKAAPLYERGERQPSGGGFGPAQQRTSGSPIRTAEM